MRSWTAWQRVALGVLSGALYFLAFPTYSLRPLGWLALVPLLLAVRGAPRRRDAAWAGAAAAMAICLGGYFWIADTAHRFWQVPWPLAVLLLCVYGTFAQIHFTAFAALAWELQKRWPAIAAAPIAAAFVLCELIVPRIFPDKLGHTLLDQGSLPHAAALLGTHGLSFVVAWCAASLEALVAHRRTRVRARAAELGLGVAVVAALAAWGAGERAAVQSAPAARTLRVALVQSNIGDPEALAADLGNVTLAIDSTVATYVGMTLRALAGQPRVDLVVWPETAVPSVPRPRVTARVQALAVALQVPIVYGSYEVERITDKRFKLFNAAFHMDPHGRVAGRYSKHKLLVFGEYVPLSARFPVLLDILPTPGEFTPGPGPTVFDVGAVRLAPVICYELLFPRVVRGGLRAGGEALVNLTNDYWFGRHLEPEQHLALTRMCAIEIGRPILRATNTGISALVDGTGTVLQRSGLWTEEVLIGSVPLAPMRWTPYARWGERVLFVVAVAASIAAFGIHRWLGRQGT